MIDVLKIFIAVVMAQFARAVILGTAWHLRELRRYRLDQQAYSGSSLWNKITGVY